MEEIIKPELDNFLRDIGISLDNYRSRPKLVNKLFYQQYKNAIWHNSGRLYKINLSYGELETYEINKPENIILEERRNENWFYKYSYWFLIVTALIAPFVLNAWFFPIKNYYKIYYFIAFVSFILFFYQDRMCNLYYKVRFFMFKK